MRTVRLAQFCLLLASASVFASAQGIITTIAGTNPAYTSLGSVAEKAPLGRVGGTAVASNGTVYVTDPDNQVVVAVAPGGALTVAAGNFTGGYSGDGGPATQASLNRPIAAAVDSAGNLYIADNGNGVIRMVSKGIISTYAQVNATSLAMDPNGNLYAFLAGNLTGIALGGMVTFSYAAATTSRGAIAYDTTTSSLWIASTDQNQILNGKPPGLFSVFAGSGTAGYFDGNNLLKNAQFNGPTGIWVDSSGTLYIVDAGNQVVRRITAGVTLDTLAGNGIAGFNGDNGAGTSVSFNNPTQISGDSNGNPVLSDTGNYRARRIVNGFLIPLAGSGNYRFGGDGGPAVNGLMNAPMQVYPDANGNYYIVDYLNNRIRKVDSKGVITTIAGNGVGGYGGDGGPSTKAVINGPSGLVVDANGNVYFSDTGNHRIRKISTDGTISTYAGTGLPGFSGDGGSVSKAQLNSPTGLGIDQLGTIYIADTGNHKVRVAYTNGTIASIAGNGSSTSSGDGGAPLAAGMTPTAVTADFLGKIYIVEQGANRVRAIPVNGPINTIAGNGSFSNSGDGGAAVNSAVAAPSSVWTDPTGNVFFCTSGALRKIDANGNISTYAGQSNSTLTGFSGDGGGAVGAQLSCSNAVGDRFGDIYIADNVNNRIRKVFAIPPTMTAKPTNLTFTVGALNNPPSQTVQLTANLSAINFSTGVSTSDGSSWLSVTPSGGGVPSTISVNVQSSNLAPGSYSGTVYVYLAGSSNALASVSVSLQVNQVPGSFTVKPVILIFLGLAGSTIAPQQLQFSGTNGATIAASASSSGGNWLSVSPSSAVIPATFTVTSNASSLSQGQYTGGILVGIPGSATTPITVPVLLTVVNPLAGPITAQPSSLTFSAAQGNNPGPQQIQLSSTTSGATFAVSANGFASVTPTTGIVPGNISVSVNSANLAPGQYSAVVTIANPGGNVTVPVNLTVTPGTGLLSVDPPVLPTLVDGSTGIAPVTLSIGASSGALSWNANVSTANGGNWLFIATSTAGASTAASGTASVSNPSSLTVLVNESGLAPGVYTGAVAVTSGTQTQTVTIRALVGGTSPIIGFAQTALVFNTVEGATTLPAQSLAVLSNGSVAKNGSTLNWSADVPVGSSWLGVTPASAANAAALTVTANPQGLKAGIYTGLVRVTSSSAAGSPQYATVILNVQAANTALPPAVQPQALFFATSQAQTITVSTGRASPFQASITTQTANGVGWLSVSPQSITVTPGATVSVNVSANVGTLAAGIYTGAVNFVPSDGSPTVSVAVKFLVPSSTTCNSSYALTMRQPANSFMASQGVPVNLEASLFDACGNAASGSQILVAFTNGDPPVILNDLGNGIYQGTWKPGGTGSVTVKARGANGSAYVATSLSGTVGAALAGLPFVSAGGAVEGAAFSAGAEVAPGEIISVFGGALGQANAQSSFPLPTTLSGIKLTIGGIDAPLFFAGSGQVNAQVPFELTPNAPAQVIARALTASGETDAAPETIAIAAARPAIFLAVAGGAQGAILNIANQLVDASNPASANDVVVIYCTGLGATTPVSSTGQAAVAGSLVVPATVTIGGASATVSYAGPAPGYVGLYQLNAVVPVGLAPTAAAPVVITQNKVSSNTATIALK